MARRPADRVDGLELIWPGKYDEAGARVESIIEPAELRRVEEVEGTGPGGRLILGDNLSVLASLAQREPESVDLIYVDPPFNTGGRFSARRRLGDSDERLIEVPAYADAWEGGAAGFLSMLAPRLVLARELLAADGSLYVHVDPTIGHAVKLLLDEVFGPQCFQREIVWRIGWLSGFKTRARNWIRNHDLIFFYVKDPARFTFNKIHTPYPEGYLRRDGKPPTGKGIPLEDVWNANEAEFHLEGRESLDSIQIKSFSREKTGWATQKNESLLRRIISASSNPGDKVADLFAGSGTTAVAAHELGREWLICDAMPLATHIARTRLLDHGASFTRIDARPRLESSPSSVHVDLARGVDGVHISLTGYEAGEPRGTVGDGGHWADYVEAWTLARLDAPTRPIFASHRGHSRTQLSLESEALDPNALASGVRLRVWDVWGGETVLDLGGADLDSLAG